MNTTELELTFPLDWEYKLIARDNPEMGASIQAALQELGFDTKPVPGKQSKNGKYRTYLVQTRVSDRESLDNLARTLSECPGVKFLL